MAGEAPVVTVGITCGNRHHARITFEFVAQSIGQAFTRRHEPGRVYAGAQAHDGAEIGAAHEVLGGPQTVSGDAGPDHVEVRLGQRQRGRRIRHVLIGQRPGHRLDLVHELVEELELLLGEGVVGQIRDREMTPDPLDRDALQGPQGPDRVRYVVGHHPDAVHPAVEFDVYADATPHREGRVREVRGETFRVDGRGEAVVEHGHGGARRWLGEDVNRRADAGLPQMQSLRHPCHAEAVGPRLEHRSRHGRITVAVGIALDDAHDL